MGRKKSYVYVCVTGHFLIFSGPAWCSRTPPWRPSAHPTADARSARDHRFKFKTPALK